MTTKTILDILGTPWTGVQIQGLEDSMKASHLSGWNLRNAPVYAVLPDRDIKLERTAVMRTNPYDRTQRDILGDASAQYQIVPNEDLGAYMLWLCNSLPGWETHSMGELDEGRKVFFAIRRQQTVELAGEEFQEYLIGTNSHDSTVPLSVLIGLVHVGSGALLNFTVNGKDPRIKLSHHRVLDRDGADIIQVDLDDYRERMRAQLEELKVRSFGTEVMLQKACREALGWPEGDLPASTETRYTNKLVPLMEHITRFPNWDQYASGSINRMDVLIAACAWHDFSSPIRKASKLGQFNIRRATRALLDPRFKDAALRRIR